MRVLVVEDEPVAQTALANILTARDTSNTTRLPATPSKLWRSFSRSRTLSCCSTSTCRRCQARSWSIRSGGGRSLALRGVCHPMMNTRSRLLNGRRSTMLSKRYLPAKASPADSGTKTAGGRNARACYRRPQRNQARGKIVTKTGQQTRANFRSCAARRDHGIVFPSGY